MSIHTPGTLKPTRVLYEKNIGDQKARVTVLSLVKRDGTPLGSIRREDTDLGLHPLLDL